VNSSTTNLAELVNAFYRRKNVIIATFLVVFSLSAYVAVTLPDVYKSSTLILLIPQKLPSIYVQSTISSSIQERVHAITQEILSRTMLEKIVNEFDLYPVRGAPRSLEGRVERLRKNIRIKTGQASNRSDGASFELSFESENPEKAMQVTARITSLFIDQNLKAREQLAVGTTSFINAEVDALRKELEEQEGQVNGFKAKHQYELPDQLDANLRMLEQNRNELQANMLRLASLQERKANLEKQLVELETAAPDAAPLQAAPLGPARPSELEARKAQLATLLTQYSERHPDVIRLKHEIQVLESTTPPREPEVRPAPPAPTNNAANRVRQTLLSQMAELNLEISGLQAKNEMTRRQIAAYQARVDSTPLRSMELSKISRNYEITLKKYQDLVAKKFESQLSENMEKKQKGEQFQLIDPAVFPQNPVRPDRRLILLIGLLGGLAAGFGLAVAWETLDTSFRQSDDLESYVNVPLLATLPAVVTRGTVLEQRREQGILILASLGILAAGFIAVRLALPFFS
jgi:polysaccharide chain length determinant protein (PEP-CTERM system associated)